MAFKQSFKIGSMEITSDPGHCRIVGELSGNHGGKLDQALLTLEIAVQSGMDALKIQTYGADCMTFNSNRPEFRLKEGLWKNQTLYELYQTAQTPFSWVSPLFEKANDLGLTLFSSPFSTQAIERLESANCPGYKIASFELVDTGLIRATAETKKPLVLSTGLATLEEITEAVEIISKYGSGELCLLHCISAYPTPLEATKFQRMQVLRDRFNVPTGFSDHTSGSVAPIAAAALGACMIEKHFSPNLSNETVDREFSLGPDEMTDLTQQIGALNKSLRQSQDLFSPSICEGEGRLFRRSIYVSQKINKGEKFSRKNLAVIRPGHGLSPKLLGSIIGMAANRDIDYGEALQLPDIAGLESEL